MMSYFCSIGDMTTTVEYENPAQKVNHLVAVNETIDTLARDICKSSAMVTIASGKL